MPHLKLWVLPSSGVPRSTCTSLSVRPVGGVACKSIRRVQADLKTRQAPAWLPHPRRTVNVELWGRHGPGVATDGTASITGM